LTNNQQYNEKELLQQLAEGSEAAFRTLFNAYRNKLYTYIFNISRSGETAEDTVHDIFLKLWVQRERLPEISNLNAYLYRMAHNHAFTVFRRMAKETLVLAELQNEQSPVTSFEGEDRIVWQEVRKTIRKAVNKLTPQQRLVFLMSRQQGLKHEEIAQKLNISPNTVKNHIVEALRFLRDEIDYSYTSNAMVIYVLYNLTII
jgi:RNA polymerase sigma-70 factor (family 1)